ncbi:MAG: histidinol dehydrogenase [Acidobacteria bacterium]|nr:MAG: histidinol dehydrogenase [Acidobacteriota bacterium]
MRVVRYGTAAWRRYREARPRAGPAPPAVERAVASILRQVRREGDGALVRLSARFDGVRVPAPELRAAPAAIRALAGRAEPAVVASLRAMAARIEAYHRRQRDRGFRFHLRDGSLLEEQVRALDSVGLYVPGGAGAYPSSVLMSAIPARVAGVPRIQVATPPRTLEASPVVAAALVLVGLEGSVFRVGGAQAVAAFAFGTRTVPAVAKVVGPGNAFVAEAKRQVRGTVEIDQQAGPSEVVVLADETADAAWVAADLLAQAEHGSGDEAAVLVTPSAALAVEVRRRVAAGLGSVANAAAARRALARYGAVVLVRDLDEAVAAVNELAPEHAELMARGAAQQAPKIVAGAVFVGPWAPVAVGDYGIGPNHILPTGGTARRSSPLSVRDFQRRQSLVRMTRSGLRRAAPGMVRVATAEGFPGHAESLRIRLNR